MADSRHSSTLDIKVNARALGGLEQMLGKVFSRQTPREFNNAVGEVNRSLEVNVRRTQEIVRELGKVKQGSDAFKRLSTDLQRANKEGRDLERTLTAINQASLRARQGGGGGGGAAGGGEGGGMMSRMAGMQAPMPGMGAIQTSLAAIPVAGLVAAGSLMAAAQTYQSRMRYEQARLDSAPFLMSSRDVLGYAPVRRRMAVEQTTQTVEDGTTPAVAGRIVEEVGTGRTARAGAAGLTTAELGAAFTQRRRAGLEGRFGKGFGGAYASLLETSFMTGVSEVTGLGAVGRRITEDQIRAEQEQRAEARAPTLAEILDPQGQQAARYRRERAALSGTGDPFVMLGEERKRQAARDTPTMRTVTELGFDDAAMRRASVRMGFNPTQGIQMAGQLGQAAGRPINAGELEQAMALQRMGVSNIGQTGGLIKQLRYAGEIGGMGGGNMDQVANLIGSAVALGLEGSEISDYLQRQTGFLDTMVKQGIGIDIDKMRDLEATLAQSGINAGWRAEAMTQNFLQGAAQVGREGPGNAAQFRLARAFGFTGEGGLDEFAKMRLGMQDPELAGKFGMKSPAEAMSAFVEQMRVGGASPEMQAMILQQGFQQAGIGQIGAQEALAMSRGMQTTRAGEFQIDTQAAERLVGAMAPSVRAEAGIEAERIGIGAKVAGAMQDLERTTNNMAGSFTNVLGPALDVVADKLQHFSQTLETATNGMWSEGPFMDPYGTSTVQP